MSGRGRRVLVTGASGFIGNALCEALQDEGAIVTALLRSPRPGPWDFVVHGELGRSQFSAEQFEGIESIFHLAGKAHTKARTAAEDAEYEAVHVRGTRALLEAARKAGVRSIVMLSSVKAMGEGGADVWDETHQCRPVGPYGITKLAAERLVLDEIPLPCPVVLRPTLVYGAGSKGNLALMIRAVRSGSFPAISFPRNARAMIHVRDVVQACLLAATQQRACGQTYILSDGNEYSTTQIFQWICEALQKTPKFSVPFGLVRLAARMGDLFERCGATVPLTSDALDKLAGSARYSNAKICSELGFVPDWDLRRGVREMIDAPGKA